MISRSYQAIQNFQSVTFWQYHRLVSPPHGDLWDSQKQNIAALEVSKTDLDTFMRPQCINSINQSNVAAITARLVRKAKLPLIIAQ